MRMSKQVKKSSSSVSFSLKPMVPQNLIKRTSLTILTLICLAYAIFIFGGGLFTLISHPLPSAYVNGVFYFLYPEISNQFISDTAIAAILYTLGFVGMLMIYQSSKSAYKPRQAYMMLIIGVTFILLAYVFLEGSISFKLNGGK